MNDEQKGSELDLTGLLDDGLRELIELVSESGVTELRIERGETRLFIKSAPAEAAASQPVPQPAAPAGGPAPTAPPGGQSVLPITSPIVGSFFSSARPGAEPFVQVGDIIAPGQTVGIVEAMKVMNNIESEIAGRVVEVLVQNGQAVEYGTELMLVDTAGATSDDS
ncbi:MAG: acetyl-CoA carboxylase biotin carboxyl carrier protein [Chloroflexota bacterium]|nr:acetyl-CoA carboxylase biotin carboxyl carrier protein [Chloroflexota bacterium]